MSVSKRLFCIGILILTIIMYHTFYTTGDMVNHMELILDQIERKLVDKIDKATSSNTVLVKSVGHDDKDEKLIENKLKSKKYSVKGVDVVLGIVILVTIAPC